jgi:hypothetical protein
MITFTKQILITIVVVVFTIGVTSFSEYNTLGITYGQESNSFVPPIGNLPGFPHLPNFPDFPHLPAPPSHPGCSPCPPGAYCAQFC